MEERYRYLKLSMTDESLGILMDEGLVQKLQSDGWNFRGAPCDSDILIDDGHIEWGLLAIRIYLEGLLAA